MYPAFAGSGPGLRARTVSGADFPRTGNLTAFGRVAGGTAPFTRAGDFAAGPAFREAGAEPETNLPFTTRPVSAAADVRCGKPAAVPVRCTGTAGFRDGVSVTVTNARPATSTNTATKVIKFRARRTRGLPSQHATRP